MAIPLPAAALWRGYFWPHAKAVFDGAELSNASQRVRRVARWLLAHQPAMVSREEIRRRALSQAATAAETQDVRERLSYLGFVMPFQRETIARLDGGGRDVKAANMFRRRLEAAHSKHVAA